MWLERVISISNAKAQILIPVFREVKGGNAEYIQEMSADGFVRRFVPVDFPFEDNEYVPKEQEIGVGEEGVWCIRMLDRTVVAKHSEMKALATEVMSEISYAQFPFFRQEMSSFLDGGSAAKGVLFAYSELSKLSKVAANVWRDAVILLPLAREGIDRSLRSAQKFDLMDVSLVSEEATSYISLPGKPINTDIKLEYWAEMARAFGITSFRLIWQSNDIRRSDIDLSESVVVGFCAMTRFVLSERPFGALQLGNHKGISYSFYQEKRGEIRSEKQAIYIIRSNQEALSAVKIIDQELLPSAHLKTAINIRPIGFGDPNKNTSNIVDVRKNLNNFDVIWIISNHRQKRNSRFATGISAQNVASRNLKRLIESLLWSDVVSIEIREYLWEKRNDYYQRKRPLICLFGYAQLAERGKLYGAILKSLQSMISIDISLRHPGKIIALAPVSKFERIYISEYSLNIEVYPSDMNTKSYVYVFVVDANISEFFNVEFSEFISDILRGYEFVEFQIVSDAVFSISIGNSKFKLLLAKNSNQLSYFVENSGPEDIIVSGVTITQFMNRSAAEKNKKLIHYSDLDFILSKIYNDFKSV
ncbi:hypothetical protein MACH10_13760 [Thalassospira tepidiphila]|uniref:hypothetical protein n=1 Tax=Thalassospira tepidiphila TaxID=393657 RepID=UPI002920B45C|nr:hypothetical protein MACH10_13760 [Thalassospira tepidiphila]